MPRGAEQSFGQEAEEPELLDDTSEDVPLTRTQFELQEGLPEMFPSAVNAEVFSPGALRVQEVTPT